MSYLESVLRANNPQTHVMPFYSLRVEQLRSVCWDEGTHVVVFPSFSHFPDINELSRTDLKHFVSRGNNLVVFGGFSNIMVLNSVFGFRLKAVTYQEGPYFKSSRTEHNTPFESAPSELPQVEHIYGVHMQSLPAGSRSYYDSIGTSVIFSVHRDFGVVTYVGVDFSQPDRSWASALRAAVAL
mmetsp:Transcript_64696/g.173431  ORF Transcript_64696/g.173431 Transcript_64696/m.173431 type:complete len:183 (+) Transcript_64696:328-876(+)